MNTETQIIQTSEEMWAIVELMGHGQTAGRVEKPTEWGGLMRVDVPADDGTFRTEFYGIAAIYSVKFVSEEIARAYAPRKHQITTYDTPIITREQHHAIVQQLEQQAHVLLRKIAELEHRLTSVQSLPELDDGEVVVAIRTRKDPTP